MLRSANLTNLSDAHHLLITIRMRLIMHLVASVCVCVSVSVCHVRALITFESLDLETYFWYAGTSENIHTVSQKSSHL